MHIPRAVLFVLPSRNFNEYKQDLLLSWMEKRRELGP